MAREIKGAEYINEERRGYSLYVLQNRAVPQIADGLVSAGRRTLWKGRDGKKSKTQALAGATMCIHPHQLPDGPINTLTAPFRNNIPLFTGEGAFGTILNPTAYGASRYTSVKISKFTEDVVFRDLEIIPLVPNYDGTEDEPVHFLPLVPICLLNPAHGTAVGFATNILPRSLEDIIMAQLMYLKTGTCTAELMAKFLPTDNIATYDGRRYVFRGAIEHINTTEIRITKLPFGKTHREITDALIAWMDEEESPVVDYDDASKRSVNITVKFRRGFLAKTDPDRLLKKLRLIHTEVENLTLIDFDQTSVIIPTPQEVICKFTEWRLGFYVARYERLKQLLEADIQRYRDVLLAIKHNIGAVARKTTSRSELKELLEAYSIVNLDYIADLPVYRFTEEEAKKVQQKLEQALEQLDEYDRILSDPNKRKKIYISELEQVLKNFNHGKYN